MNQILDKFIKKVQKITKWTILLQNDEEILVSVPIDIDINVHYKNWAASQELNQSESRVITSLFLCTTNPKSKLAISCRKSNILVIDNLTNVKTPVNPLTSLTSERVSHTPGEIEEAFKKRMMTYYDLFTKRGDGH